MVLKRFLLSVYFLSFRRKRDNAMTLSPLSYISLFLYVFWLMQELNAIVVDSDLPAAASRQTLLYSATFSPPVRKAAVKYLRPSAAMATVGAARVASPLQEEEEGREGNEATSNKGGLASILAASGSGITGSSSIGGAAAALVAQSVVAVPPGGDRRHKLGALLLPTSDSMREVATATYSSSSSTSASSTTVANANFGLLEPSDRTIVFVETKRDAAWLARQLNGLERFGGSGQLALADDDDGLESKGGTETLADLASSALAGTTRGALAVKVVGGARAGDGAAELHGDLTQAQRDKQLNRFRNGQASVLVCTDVASRGLDVPNVDHVVCVISLGMLT